MSIASHARTCGAALLLLVWTSIGTAETELSHASWSALLASHVEWNAGGTATKVDYDGFERDRAQLQTYLDRLSALSPSDYAELPLPERIAFLLNAYNAFTIEFILRADSRPESIKDLGSWLRSPWKQRFFDLLGASRSLDEVEHELLRRNEDYPDPRIHFAVNCASIGCPALRPEAYVGDALEQQLEDQTRRFLADRSRNRAETDGRSLRISPIFDWYEEDFERGWRGTDSVSAFLTLYADSLGLPTEKPTGEPWRVRYSEYDWRLNDQY
jgi:hypothetical protein